MELNTIICGDSQVLLKELDVNPKLIIMSPPDLAETNYSLDEYKAFLKSIYASASEKLSEGGVLVSVTTDRKMKGTVYTKHIDIINSTDLQLFNYKIWAKTLKVNLYILTYSHMLFFKKGKVTTNNKITEFYPDIWLLELDKINGYKNKDSFPTELVKRLILNFTNEEDLVLDPFIGTGKTGKVCLENNRMFVGFDIDKDIVNQALIYLKND